LIELVHLQENPFKASLILPLNKNYEQTFTSFYPSYFSR
jgi:hypothetical protein